MDQTKRQVLAMLQLEGNGSNEISLDLLEVLHSVLSGDTISIDDAELRVN